MATDSTPLIQIKPAAEAPLPRIGIEAARHVLAKARGPKYWRTLEELTNQPGFTDLLEREFPRFISEWTDTVSRRNFLKVMSASLALAGLSACTRQPEEATVPYVQQPEDLVPGKAMYFATARPHPFGAQPLLVKSNEFRPTKIEGNPEHPVSRGSADVYSQASILDLYDPDRAQAVTYNGGLELRRGQNPGVRNWGEFVNDLRQAAAAEKVNGGAGIRFLTETIISPTQASQIRDVLRDFPRARWYQYDAVNRDSARAGSRMAFGQYLETQYQLDKADIIVSFDADFLGGGHFPGFPKLARDFAGRRRLDGDPKQASMARFYVVESQATPTGGKADHRLALPLWQVEQFASALAGALGAGGGGRVDEKSRKFFEVLVKELQSARGRAVVIAGEQLSPAVHALVHSINGAIGAVGQTVVYTDTVETNPVEQVLGLKELVADMNGGRVKLLVIVGTNPVYSAPADLNFKGALQKVPFRATLSTHRDETAQLSHWHVPMAHYLESWSDGRAYDGTVTIIQPLIEPLYGGRTAHDIFAAFTDAPGTTAYDAVRNYWKSQIKGDFESAWHRALHDGWVQNTAATPRTVTVKPAPPLPSRPTELEIVFRPDPNIFDGRFNNNGFLQELSKPVTKLTWDNAALMSLNTYQQLGFEAWRPKEAPMIEISTNGQKIQAPAMIVPGHPDKSITVHLGYGREVTGRVGEGTGFNAALLRSSPSPNWAAASVVKTGETYQLAITQHHHLIDQESGFAGVKRGEKGTTEVGVAAFERGVVRSASLEQYKQHPDFASDGVNEPPAKDMTLFAERGYVHWTDDPEKRSPHQWGMTIDLNSCVGCNNCVAACYVENNIPIVGKDQVLRGREMDWIRIDTYFEADYANPRAYFQPVPCMQCENAPCEPVCPVAATTHSPEGLNNMVYNRCVGTRYCQNNCPYKVRRFNFLLYSDWDTESLKPMRNPDVTVRSRGVMEKCTYCVQRINAARITAEKENRRIRDGEIQTACQQACPTAAIIFGDIADPSSRVSKLKAQQRNYGMLAEINTRPRTTYLAEIRNFNAQLESQQNPGEGPGHVG